MNNERVLLLYGTFKNINQYIKISAYGFSATCVMTSIYLIINKQKGFVIFIILSILPFLIALKL